MTLSVAQTRACWVAGSSPAMTVERRLRADLNLRYRGERHMAINGGAPSGEMFLRVVKLCRS
jgi:hypothetical protein